MLQSGIIRVASHAGWKILGTFMYEGRHLVKHKLVVLLGGCLEPRFFNSPGKSPVFGLEAHAIYHELCQVLQRVASLIHWKVLRDFLQLSVLCPQRQQ